jgi:hypothetical protein
VLPQLFSWHPAISDRSDLLKKRKSYINQFILDLALVNLASSSEEGFKLVPHIHVRTLIVIASSDTQKAPCIFQLLSDEPSLSSVLQDSQASVKESVQKVPEEESAGKYLHDERSATRFLR